MSDERIFDPVDGLPDPADDPTAALLRDVLTREADAVRPAPDGLTRIRAAIETETSRGSVVRRLVALPGRRGGTRRPDGRHGWAPVLAAAAAVVLLAGVGGFAVNRWPIVSKESGEAAQQQEVPPPDQLPVYVVGQVTGPDGRVEYGLYREYRPTTARQIDDRLAEALTDAVVSRPEDPDYVRVFGGGGSTPIKARWDQDAGVIDVTLTPAMITVQKATDARAQIAIQQVVWTASAVLAEVRPGSADVPVRIRVAGESSNRNMFGRSTYVLGGTFSRAHGPDDPTAPVWLVDPKDADTLGRKWTEIGVSVGYTARRGVPWTLTRDGTLIAKGTATPGFRNGAPNAVPGSRGAATIIIDHRLPGEYVLTVSEPGTEPAPRWSDTKAFTVN